ncbi:MAG: hypothetical protein NC205_04160 [Prevotella sp.]|nr:hypothetical protein [Prevotella sp.]
MILLKILLYVLFGVLGLILAMLILALVLPVRAEVNFISGRLTYKLKFAFISLIDSAGGGILKKKKSESDNKEPEEFQESYSDYDYYDSEDIEEENNIDIDIPVIEDIGEPEECIEDDGEMERSEKIRKIKEKKSRKKEEVPPEENYDSEEEEEEKENSLTDKIEFIINIWDIAGRPFLKIFRGFHIKKVYIDFIVANEDACKCAINYGIVSGAVYNLLAWLGELFTVSYKTVDIRSGFSLKKSQWDASCKVDFRLYTLVVSILWFIIVYTFKIYIPKKQGLKKSGK